MNAMKRFLDLEDLDDATISRLLSMAEEVERGGRRDDLRERTLGLVFMNPSLRTLASFQAAMSQLGGNSFVIMPGQGTWALETRDGTVMDGVAAEHVREAIPVLEQYADGLGLRCFAEGQNLEQDLSEPVLHAVEACARKPLISLESAMNHPCQALADWKTLDDLKVPAVGGKFVLSWAWHPRALPLAVPAAAVGMAARRGMDVTVLCPEGYELPSTIMDRARAAAEKAGGSLRETSDRAAAMEGAHVLYAKSWRAPSVYAEPDLEDALRARLRDWCVDESWYGAAESDAAFMHCLPVRRNVVVKDEVLDGPRSRVVQQAGNRLHVQKAVLLEMLK